MEKKGIWSNFNSNYLWIIRGNQIIEFLHNSKFPAKSWQDHASIEGEEQNKKIIYTRDWTYNLQIISPTLCQLC